MQQFKDERYLAEIFSRAARIPRAKIDEAVEDNSILEVINNPHLMKTATPTEIRRVEDLTSFREQYEAVASADRLKYQISRPEDAYHYLGPEMANLATERVDMLVLNTRHRVIKRQTLCTGSLSSCGLSVQQIIRTAVLYNASAVMLAHNHPSGDTKPSPDDISSTRSIRKALDLVQVDLVDHIVVGKHGYSSFREMGMLEEKETYGATVRETGAEYGGSTKDDAIPGVLSRTEIRAVGKMLGELDLCQRGESDIREILKDLGDLDYFQDTKGNVIWPIEALQAFSAKELETCKKILFQAPAPAHAALQQNGGRTR